MSQQQIEPNIPERNKRVIDKLQNQPGIVAAWGTGVGKTKLSIDAYKTLGLPANVIAPAALQDNYKKELQKWIGHQPSDLNIESQQRVALRGKPNTPIGGFEINDESHKARNHDSKLLNALKQGQPLKRLLLTASPVYNHPADIAPLINLAANKELLPENRREFSDQFIGQKDVKPGFLGRLMGVHPGTQNFVKQDPRLISALNKYVDFQPGSREEFPTGEEQRVEVPMSPAQQDIYKTIMGRAPMWVRWKVNHGLPPGKGELTTLQAFLTGARQVANSNYDFVNDKNQVQSPKINAAFNYLNDQIKANPRYKGVVYSNYLNSGLQPYKDLLTKNKIPYGEFSGQVSPELRNQMVRDYNANKLKALLISSAGAEGLDLKGTRLVQILEPHFNKEKEKQIIGRAIRYRSHADLPPEEQKVLIQKYLSRPQGGWLDRMLGNDTVRGTDEYISGLADRKEELNKQLMQMIQKYSS